MNSFSHLSFPDYFPTMSVAATRSEISHNPGKMSVTSAVSGEKVEGDVQSRMKLFGAIQAFRDG